MTTCPVLFILGDSISIDYGPFLERMLAGRFSCDRKGSEILAAENPGQKPARQDILQRLAMLDRGSPALNGGDSNAVLAYLQGMAAHLSPDCPFLLLNCGLHDLRLDPQTGAHQVEPEDYSSNLEEIIRLASTVGRRVIWVRTTPVADALHQRMNPDFQRFNADVITYNGIADAKINKAGIQSIDLYSFTLGLCDTPERLDDLYTDHIHFKEEISRLQAAYIAGWLDAQQYT
jgi:lysophospholipase L1-like esterase